MHNPARQHKCFAEPGFAPNVDFNQKMKETNMNKTFNRDVLTSQWTQIRSQVKQNWSKLTDSDLDRISGRFEELVKLVQERYGHTREKAEKEVTHFIEQFTMREPHSVR